MLSENHIVNVASLIVPYYFPAASFSLLQRFDTFSGVVADL